MGWFVLPAIRKELCVYLVKEKGFSRAKTAEALGLTQAAVCQYLKSRRGNSFKFNKEEKKSIHKLGSRLAGEDAKGQKQELLHGSCELCKKVRNELRLCSMHSSEQSKPFAGCTVCSGA